MLHLHRNSTGYEIYRVSFGERPEGAVGIDRLLVEGNEDRYRMGTAQEEARSVEQLIDAMIARELVAAEPIFEVGLPIWQPHIDSERRKASAVRLAELVLAAGDDVTLAHRKEFLSIAIWKYTEADGKYDTRYRSAASIGEPVSTLHHEHVFTRKALVAQLLEEPERCSEIMATAVGCVILREEHKKLAVAERANPELTGWGRYSRAGVRVIDLATGAYKT